MLSKQAYRECVNENNSQEKQDNIITETSYDYYLYNFNVSFYFMCSYILCGI